MNVLYFLAASVTLWCGAPAKDPTLDTINADLQLDTDEMLVTRPGSESYVYQFPNPVLRVTDGTTVNLFGVMTAGDFTLHFLPLEDTPKPEPFTLTKTSKGWDVQYSSFSRHYEDPLVMPKGQFIWFIIERTNSYVALYRVSEAKPLLLVSNYVLKKLLNFNTLQKFRVSSTKEALWDFQGFKYDKKEEGGTPRYPFLDAALERMKKAYIDVVTLLKRCKFAEANIKTASDANNERLFLTVFRDRFCRDKRVVVQIMDMEVRYKAQMLAAGIIPPRPPTDDKCRKDIVNRKSLRF